MDVLSEGLGMFDRRFRQDAVPEVEDMAGPATHATEDLVSGIEINTDAYTRATGSAVEPEIDKIIAIAAEGAAHGYKVYAGHGLTVANVGPVAATPEIEELNIGHSIVSRASLVGIAAAVSEMLEAIAAAQPPMTDD